MDAETLQTIKEVDSFTCPQCGVPLRPVESGMVSCGKCDWQGEAYLYKPLLLQYEKAQEALPDDATCIHHPTKAAVARCEGTGSFICSLCAAEINGKIYSIQYLDSVGKDKIEKAFDKYLERPDLKMSTAFIISWLFCPLFLVALPLSIYWYVRMFTLRAENELYARVVGPVTLVLYGFVLLALAGFALFAFIGVLGAAAGAAGMEGF